MQKQCIKLFNLSFLICWNAVSSLRAVGTVKWKNADNLRIMPDQTPTKMSANENISSNNISNIRWTDLKTWNQIFYSSRVVSVLHMFLPVYGFKNRPNYSHKFFSIPTLILNCTMPNKLFLLLFWLSYAHYYTLPSAKYGDEIPCVIYCERCFNQ